MSKVRKVEFLSVGGGIGSFCWVDTLRIHGVPANKIAVISPYKKPYTQLKKYCDAIKLTEDEKFRSDSGSRPDNFWGFPGYGLSEALDELKNHKFTKALKLIFQLFFEPFIFGYYSPTAGRVYKAIDRESERISWRKCLISGYATNLTKLSNGSFKINYNQNKSIIANVVHLSLGHSQISTSENTINAYEITDKKWEFITKSGGVVMVIGRGASAQKIIDYLLKFKNIKIVSLHRETEKTNDFRGLTQKRFLSWRLQQFNWPKAVFGGGLMDKIDPIWSLPSATPDKKWLTKLKKAIKVGKYRITKTPIKADFVINCSGFIENVFYHKFYSKLCKNTIYL